MSGIINVSEHNAKVDEIERAKTILDWSKPQTKTIFKIDSKCKVIFSINSSNGKISDNARIIDHQDCLNRNNGYNTYNDYLTAIAACIIKALGPIPQELIDSVIVE